MTSRLVEAQIKVDKILHRVEMESTACVGEGLSADDKAHLRRLLIEAFAESPVWYGTEPQDCVVCSRKGYPNTLVHVCDGCNPTKTWCEWCKTLRASCYQHCAVCDTPKIMVSK